MAHISYYREDERIKDVRSLLLRVNPLHKDIKEDVVYLDFAECLHYLYIHSDKKKLEELIPLFINELLNAASYENKETISNALASLYDAWTREDNNPKRYHDLEHFKPYVWIKKHLTYFKGLGAGLLIMFLFMLEIALKMK